MKPGLAEVHTLFLYEITQQASKSNLALNLSQILFFLAHSWSSLEVVASSTFEASTQSLLSSSLLQLLFGSPLSLKGLTHFTRSCSVAVSSFFR